ncbi:MAG: right-handed parallel beta-helix repeat-containing protein, partial [Bacteroidota bacterium]
GSVTKQFTVKNPHDKKIEISDVRLAGDKSSNYRLNINGVQSHKMTDVELAGNDSMYIFVEVTVDPTNQNNPMVIKDSIVFETNSNTQDVKLVSWGQDVHKINGEVIGTDTWEADKPYLIYNSALIDSGATLTIEPGANIHFHRNSRFYVAGTVHADGTEEDPIVFQGDRLGSDYEDVPGQWDGIWLMQGSKNNVMDYVEIKNAIIGLQVDTLGNTTAPTLAISNSKIKHMSYAGIYAQGTNIEAYNCVIGDCGSYALALTLGGNYEFYHSTIGNYWHGSTRSTPSVVLNNYYTDTLGNIITRGLEKAVFGNCIIYGNKGSEILLDKKKEAAFNVTFDHSLLKLDPETDTNNSYYNNIILNKDPRFVSTNEHDLLLDTLSPAIDKGSDIFGQDYPFDIEGNSRISDEGPDIGAYERTPDSDNQ